MTSRWATVLLALASQLRATTGYRDPDTRGNGIPVFLGMQYGITDQDTPTWLALAWSGDPESPEDSGSWDQVVAGHAATGRPRNETGEIRFLVSVSRGDVDFASALTTAFGVLAVLETEVRDDPYVGLGAASNTWWTQVVSGTPRLSLDSGATVEIEGRLRYEARL